MGAIKANIEAQLPGVFVYSVEIGNTTNEDIFHSFISNVDDQVAFVCETLANIPEMQGTSINAVGFSQGSQFLRAYVERCNNPPVHNLITWGGQHMGVSDFPNCADTNLTACQLAADLLDEGAYAPFVRSHVVQAQYFKDPMNINKYLEYNQFLADINNERSSKNATYKANLISLNAFLMVMFENDTIVVPRASEHFGQFVPGSITETQTMFETDLFIEDYIGLKELWDDGRIAFAQVPGEHMQFTLDTFNQVCLSYLAN